MPIIKTYYKVHRVYPDPDYFWMENTSGNTATFTVQKSRTPASTDLSYSLDKVTWTDIHDGGTITSVSNGAKVYFRSSTGLNSSNNDYYTLKSNYNFDVGGHIYTLVDYTSSDFSVLPQYCLYRLFWQSGVVHANIDFSGVTTIENNALNSTFLQSYHLITPPDLSSVTSVSNQAFYSTFESCTSLQTPVDLTNLTTVGPGGLYCMYNQCSALNDAIAPNVSSWDVNKAYYWLSGTAATGVVRKPAGLTIPTDSPHGVPTGWETENY